MLHGADAGNGAVAFPFYRGWATLHDHSPATLGIALTVFALLFDFLKRRKSWSRYPPGPTSLPFIGTMLQIDFHNPHLSFTQVSARGDIWSP
uniref:Uncharacterized protein n=1 Tax=Gopherus evgoodei TaxID=1825980 RepID=A0A8C4VHW7_9SAUR